MLPKTLLFAGLKQRRRLANVRPRLDYLEDRAVPSVLYNEATDGDLSSAQSAPTQLTAALGTNSVLGTVGGASGSQDWLTLHVPAGMGLDQLVLAAYSSTDAQGFTGVQAGTSFVGSVNTQGNYLGYVHFGTGAVNGGSSPTNLVGTDLLPTMGNNTIATGSQGFTPPLASGDYTFLIQQLGASTDYQFDYDTIAVPVPDLTVVKSHIGNFTQGDSADTYKIVVTNSGVASTSGTVTVSDLLPVGLQPTAADNANINGWNVSFVGQAITATRSDVLAAGNPYPDLNLTVSVDDTATNLTNTATVSGGGETDSSNDSSDDPTTIDPGHVNEAPVNTLPATFTGAEDMPLVLTGVSVTDADAGTADIQVTLSVNSGSLSIATGVAGGVTGAQVSGNNSNSVVVTASQIAIDATLADVAGLTLTPALNFNGNITLSMLTSDLGHTGITGPKFDSDSSTITLSAVNDAPVNTLPSSFATTSDSALVLSGISIADVDAGSSLVSVVLSADNGTLALNTSVVGGLSGSEITGNGSSTLSVLAPLATINATLADTAGLFFMPTGGFAGTAGLTLVTNDLGNTGSGGPLTDADSASITVTPLLDHFTIDLPATQTAGVPFTVTVTARNAAGGVVTNFGGAIDLSKSDPFGSLPTQATFTAGVASFSATLQTATSQTIAAVDSSDASIRVLGAVNVTPGAPARLNFVQQPEDTLLSSLFLTPVRLTATDAFGNPETSDNTDVVTIRLQSNSAGARLAGTTSVKLVNGTAVFPTLMLNKAGTGFTLAASSASLPVTFSDSFSVVAVSRFSVSTTTTMLQAGLVINNLKVQALDTKGQLVTTYPGTIHFSSTDLQAVLPADTTLAGGQGTFSVILETAADSNITVNDVAKPTTKGSMRFPISVTPASASDLRITAPGITITGQKQKVTISAVDPFGNIDPSYLGNVILSSSDGSAVLPAAYQFTAKDAGKHTFTVTLKTPGLRSLSADDSSFHETLSNIVVAGTTPQVVPQADVETGTTLVVIGTAGNNTLTVQPSNAAGTQLEVLSNGISLGSSFVATGHVLVYGLGGNDTLSVLEGTGAEAGVKIPNAIVLDGGTGNDTLNASGAGGNAILLGGDGNDKLTGSENGDILIGGKGMDTIHGGAGEDILIGSNTTLDGNLSALFNVMAEWSNPGADFVTRVQHLSAITPGGLSDPFFLENSTVPNDTSVDQLFGEGDSDWFLYAATGKVLDKVLDPTGGEFLTGL